MQRRSLAVALAWLVCIGLGNLTALAQEPASRLEIRNVTLDPLDGRLVVNGTGFGEHPIVTLDGQRLDALPGGGDMLVSVVAPLSVITVAGTYRITIVDPDTNVGDTFVLAVPPPSAVVTGSAGQAAATVPAASAGTGTTAPSAAPGEVTPQAIIEDSASPYRTAIGAGALSNNTGTGLGNTAAGHYTLYSNTSGGLNTGIGAWSLYSSTTGNYNTAAGYTSLWSNTTGSYNTALGNMSLYQNTIGQANTAVGSEALITATNATSNTAVGISALRSTSGSNNTAIGAFAGYYATTGAHNVFVGAQVRGTAADANTIRIGAPYDGAIGQNRAFVAGIRGTAVSGSLPVVIDASGQLGTADTSGLLAVGPAANVSAGPSLRLQGDAVSDGAGHNYGSYGSFLLNANSSYTSGARRFLLTNALNLNSFAILRSAGANTDPTLGAAGTPVSGTPDFVIDNTGRVGIGTAAPTQLLTVGPATGVAAGPSVRIQGDAVADGAGHNYGSYGSILLNANSSYTSGARRFLVTNALNLNTFAIVRSPTAASDPSLSTAGALASGTVDFAISNTGYVGIGTSTPWYPLHAGNGAYLSTGGVWTNASSRTLKQDIADLPLDAALSTVKALAPVTYAYKASPSERHVGFIAEDVPDLVATGDRKSLAAMDIVAVLTRVVQAQQETLKTQQAAIDDLKAEAAALKAVVLQLQAGASRQE